MKTRTFQTRYWQDDFIIEAPRHVKHIYCYLLTCEGINITGIFQLSRKTIAFHTDYSVEEVINALDYLENNNKVYYRDGWIFVKNAIKNNKYYKSPRNWNALVQELSQVPNILLQEFYKFSEDIYNSCLEVLQQVKIAEVNGTTDKVVENFDKNSLLKVMNIIKNITDTGIDTGIPLSINTNNKNKEIVDSVDETLEEDIVSNSDIAIDTDINSDADTAIDSGIYTNLKPETSKLKSKIKKEGGMGETKQDPYSKFIEILNNITKRNYRGDSKSKKQFESRIKQKYTLEDFAIAIKNCASDPFHIENPNYLTPEFITREDKLNKYLNYNPPPGTHKKLSTDFVNPAKQSGNYFNYQANS